MQPYLIKDETSTGHCPDCGFSVFNCACLQESLGRWAEEATVAFSDFSHAVQEASEIMGSFEIAIQMPPPKKPIVRELRQAKIKEQLKTWGLRK